MWTTGWTALEFDVNGSYRRMGNGPSATPLLGLHGGEINNVPCFAEPRAARHGDADRHAQPPHPAGQRRGRGVRLFRLLARRQPGRRPLPDNPTHNGPFNDDDDRGAEEHPAPDARPAPVPRRRDPLRPRPDRRQRDAGVERQPRPTQHPLRRLRQPRRVRVTPRPSHVRAGTVAGLVRPVGGNGGRRQHVGGWPPPSRRASDRVGWAAPRLAGHLLHAASCRRRHRAGRRHAPITRQPHRCRPRHDPLQGHRRRLHPNPRPLRPDHRRAAQRAATARSAKRVGVHGRHAPSRRANIQSARHHRVPHPRRPRRRAAAGQAARPLRAALRRRRRSRRATAGCRFSTGTSASWKTGSERSAATPTTPCHRRPATPAGPTADPATTTATSTPTSASADASAGCSTTAWATSKASSYAAATATSASRHANAASSGWCSPPANATSCSPSTATPPTPTSNTSPWAAAPARAATTRTNPLPNRPHRNGPRLQHDAPRPRRDGGHGHAPPTPASASSTSPTAPLNTAATPSPPNPTTETTSTAATTIGTAKMTTTTTDHTEELRPQRRSRRPRHDDINHNVGRVSAPSRERSKQGRPGAVADLDGSFGRHVRSPGRRQPKPLHIIGPAAVAAADTVRVADQTVPAVNPAPESGSASPPSLPAST